VGRLHGGGNCKGSGRGNAKKKKKKPGSTLERLANQWQGGWELAASLPPDSIELETSCSSCSINSTQLTSKHSYLGITEKNNKGVIQKKDSETTCTTLQKLVSKGWANVLKKWSSLAGPPTQSIKHWFHKSAADTCVTCAIAIAKRLTCLWALETQDGIKRLQAAAAIPKFCTAYTLHE